MRRKNDLSIKLMREINERSAGIAAADEAKKFSGAIRSQFVNGGDNMISTAEMKVCIDEIDSVLSSANKDERMEKIVAVLKEIYEPVKTCKNIPVVRSAKRIVDIVGELRDSDPEILKTIFAKCEANVETNETVKHIVERRENYYGKLRF